MQKLQLLNFDNAVNYLIQCMRKKEDKVISSMGYLNQKRYAFITFNYTERYLVLFKRDFYHKFGEMFKDKGEEGLGESINIEGLKLAFQRECIKIFFIYESGYIYSISPQDIVMKGYKRETYAEGKEVYSFSIKHLERYN